MILEGDPGSLSDVGEFRNEHGFTLCDIHDAELIYFSFHTEQAARTAHKMLSHVVTEAMAMCPAQERCFVSTGET